jgi:hypothetical protein
MYSGKIPVPPSGGGIRIKQHPKTEKIHAGTTRKAETKMAEMPILPNYPLLIRHWKDSNRGPTVSLTLAHSLKRVIKWY